MGGGNNGFLVIYKQLGVLEYMYFASYVKTSKRGLQFFGRGKEFVSDNLFFLRGKRLKFKGGIIKIRNVDKDIGIF